MHGVECEDVGNLLETAFGKTKGREAEGELLTENASWAV